MLPKVWTRLMLKVTLRIGSSCAPYCSRTHIDQLITRSQSWRSESPRMIGRFLMSDQKLAWNGSLGTSGGSPAYSKKETQASFEKGQSGRSETPDPSWRRIFKPYYVDTSQLRRYRAVEGCAGRSFLSRDMDGVIFERKIERVAFCRCNGTKAGILTALARRIVGRASKWERDFPRHCEAEKLRALRSTAPKGINTTRWCNASRSMPSNGNNANVVLSPPKRRGEGLKRGNVSRYCEKRKRLRKLAARRESGHMTQLAAVSKNKDLYNRNNRILPAPLSF